MRGTTKRDGQEVEYEVVAISRKARKDLRAAVAGDEDPAEWQNLRAAVLCIGIGEYEALRRLPNAVRDAQALCEKVNALPHCRAKLLADLPDRRAIQRGIRNFLRELQKAPPDTVFVHYSGHGMQRGGTVYMLPGDADLGDSACDPDADFLPIRDIFKYFREDLDMLARMLNPPRQVTFVLVVDACRVAEMDQATLSSSLEPPPGSAPISWALCFSCSRDSTASDGPQGAHSPFAQELLDEKAGIFAAGVPLKGGLEEACRRLHEQHRGQAPMPVGLHSIQEDWCFYPDPAPRVYSGNVPTAGKTCPRRDSQLDQEVVHKLQEWDLEDAADALARAGCKSLKRLRKMIDGDVVDKLGLPIATARELRDLVQSLKAEDLQLPPAAGAVGQEAAAAKKAEGQEAKKKAEVEATKKAVSTAVEEAERKEEEPTAAKKKAEEEAKEERTDTQLTKGLPRERQPLEPAQGSRRDFKLLREGIDVVYIGKGRLLGGEKRRQGTLKMAPGSLERLYLLRETFNNSSALENGVVKWTARVTEVQADKHQEAGVVLKGEDKVVVHFAGWEARDEYFDQLMLLQQAQLEEEARKKVARAAARLKLEQELVALASTARVKELHKMSQHDRNLALIKAAKDGKPDTVKELLAANADVEARDGRGRTPLNYCCQSSGHVGVATLLLDRGAAVNMRCRESGATDLHDCVYWNHLGVAELLVDRGAPVDARDDGGWTPLMQARIHKRQELAALFRARGGIAYHTTAYGSGMLVSNRILGF